MHPATSLRHALGKVRDSLFKAAYNAFDRLLPVRDDYWCFVTWPGYGHTLDNPRAVFEEVRTDPGITKIILLRDRLPPTVTEPGAVRFVYAESLAGTYYLARSRVVLLGYALTSSATYAKLLRAPRHLIIHLGHGIPLKRVGRLVASEKFWLEETVHYAALPCSSETDRAIQLDAFAPTPRGWLTGLPRNDTILKPDAALPADFRGHLASLDARLAGRRLVLYAPTWRNDSRTLYLFSKKEVDAFTSMLRRHEAVLGIHGHPNSDWRRLFKEIPDSPVVMSVRDLPEINVILRRVDVLITDYSSVYVDFLLLNRPIIHFAYDLERYQAERGFFYTPEEAFGGPCARTFDELLHAVDQALTDPNVGRQKRDEARRLFHTHGPDSAANVASKIRDLVVESRGQR